MDLGDKRTMEFPITAREIADDLVRELNGDSGEGSFHGMFAAAGPLPTESGVGGGAQEVGCVSPAIGGRGGPGVGAFAQSDVHHGLERRAARELKLDKPWLYDPKPQAECPACGEKIKAGVAVCRFLPGDSEPGEGSGVWLVPRVTETPLDLMKLREKGSAK